jgi:Asp-tRNA(Asn)/Glu-tRNA(Gln) amidotransferase A subunit family amidase
MRSYRSGTATVLANLAGLPAVSVPGARSSTGLRVGVQFMAAPHADAALLRVTAALEAVRGADFAPVAHVS